MSAIGHITRETHSPEPSPPLLPLDALQRVWDMGRSKKKGKVALSGTLPIVNHQDVISYYRTTKVGKDLRNEGAITWWHQCWGKRHHV